MKVKELRKKLKKFNPNAKIGILKGDSIKPGSTTYDANYKVGVLFTSDDETKGNADYVYLEGVCPCTECKCDKKN